MIEPFLLFQLLVYWHMDIPTVGSSTSFTCTLVQMPPFVYAQVWGAVAPSQILLLIITIFDLFHRFKVPAAHVQLAGSARHVRSVSTLV